MKEESPSTAGRGRAGLQMPGFDIDVCNQSYSTLDSNLWRR
jgi:hypothetical protein